MIRISVTRHHRARTCCSQLLELPPSPIAIAIRGSINNFNLRKLALFSSSSHFESQSQPRPALPSLPIAAFVDLDAVPQKRFRREVTESLVAPLLAFERRVNKINNINNNNNKDDASQINRNNSKIKKKKNKNDNTNNNQLRIEAFGNNLLGTTTRKYLTRAEKSQLVANQKHAPWDGKVAHTGFDDEGRLRCGVCNNTITLTKNDKQRLKTSSSSNDKAEDEDIDELALLHEKLTKHMKVHDDYIDPRLLLDDAHEFSDEEKEILKKKAHNRQVNRSKYKQNKVPILLPESEEDRYEKYQSAQVGLEWLEQKVLERQKKKRKELALRNKLFKMLKKVGVSVSVSASAKSSVSTTTRRDGDGANEALIGAADRWMQDVAMITTTTTTRGSKEEEEEEEEAANKESIMLDKLDDDAYILDVYRKNHHRDDNDNIQQQQHKNNGVSDEEGCKGVLVVYSKDGDHFGPLLERAKEKGFLAVSMTDEMELEQTTAGLLRSSDVVLGPFSKRWKEDRAEIDRATRDDVDGDGGKDHAITDVPRSARMSSLSSESGNGNDLAIDAISVSDNGFQFMSKRAGVGEENSDDLVYRSNTESIVRWHLTDGQKRKKAPGLSSGSGFTTRQGMAESKANDTTSNADVTVEAKQVLSTIQQIRKNQQIAGKSKERIDAPDKFCTVKELEPKRERIYQCKGCGEQTRTWFRLKKHMRDCEHATKQMQHMPERQHVVFQYPGVNDGSNNDDQGNETTTNHQPQSQNHEVIITEDILDSFIKNKNGRYKYEKAFDGLTRKEMRKKLKERQKYECQRCGDRVQHWSQFVDHIRNCDHCGKKVARKMGKKNERKKYAIYVVGNGEEEEVENADGSADEELIKNMFETLRRIL